VWTDKRIRAICASLGIGQTAASNAATMGQFPSALMVATYLAEQKVLLHHLVDYVRANLSRNDSLSVRKFCEGVNMIMSGAGMATITAAHGFSTTAQTAATLLPVVAQEAAKLDAVITALKKDETELTTVEGMELRGLGDMFPYARSLELPGVEFLNATRYPSLCYCAWYYKAKESTTYRQMVHPQADNAKTLAAFTSVSLLQGYNTLNRESRELLEQHGITESAYAEVMRKVEAAQTAINPQDLVSTQTRISVLR